MARNLPTLRLNEDNLGPAMLVLNEAQRVFVHCIVFGGMSHRDAAEAAGYSDSSPEVLSAHGSRLVRTPRIQEAIAECAKQLLKTEGPASIRELIRIRDKGEDDKVRLKAAAEILDRAGLTGGHTIDVQHTHRLSPTEQDRRIMELAKELGLDEANTQRLLIDPANIIDAQYEEVPAEQSKPPAELVQAPINPIDDDLSDIL